METYHLHVQNLLENLVERGLGISPFSNADTSCLPALGNNVLGFLAHVRVNQGLAKLRFDVYSFPGERSLCVVALDVIYKGLNQHNCHQWCGNHAYVNLLCERQRSLAFPKGTQYDNEWVETVLKPRELDQTIKGYLKTIDAFLSA